jgi:mono/diheme cytochrome c family protein
MRTAVTMRRLVAATLVAVIVAALAIAWFVEHRKPVATPEALAHAIAALDPVGTADPVTRGRYLAAAGDCIGCHQARGGAPFAGGLAVPTPFGRIYTSNIAPDRETGIGTWSADDFWRALHQGKGKHGEYLYPAFPYPNYTRITRADADALYAFLRSVPAVRRENTPNELVFPVRWRPLMFFWRALYFRERVYEADAQHTAQWNRGAYLASGLGHCVACHSPRAWTGGTARKDELSGGLIPEQNWYAPSLTSDNEAGLGLWSVDEVVGFLKHGITDRYAAFGPMAEVIHDGTQHLDEGDLRAMAVYLKSLPPRVSDDAPPMKTTEGMRAAAMDRGARIYADQCADCHRASGEGVARAYPALARNPSVIMASTINAIRVTLNGGFAPGTTGNPRPFGMPPFAQRLDDADIAAVLTYVRNSWGNRAPAVAPADVQRFRSVPLD